MGGITISDWLIILATISGPILAVQAQKFIERRTAQRDLRLSIFYRLMTYRATPLAPERVQALNMIDLEFRPNWLGRQSAKDKAVTTAWHDLLDALNQGGGNLSEAAQSTLNQRCEDLTTALLSALSRALGFNFTNVELKRGAYYPIGHGAREGLQLSIMDNLRKVLAGELSVPMRVTHFPVSDEAVKLQERLQNGMLEALSGAGELHVRVKGPAPEPSPAAE
jgi:hypothetical protein